MTRNPQPHGTTAAYYQHLKMNEPPCEACLDAYREYDRLRHNAYRAGVRAQERERHDAWMAACEHLIALHREEWEVLHATELSRRGVSPLTTS
jgi:hypothetical protein